MRSLLPQMRVDGTGSAQYYGMVAATCAHIDEDCLATPAVPPLLR